MTKSLSNDVILHNIFPFINDKKTYSRLIRLNKYVYKRYADLIYYGLFDIKLSAIDKKFFLPKDKIIHLQITYDIYNNQNITIDLRDFINLQKLSFIGKNNDNVVTLLYPKKIKELAIKSMNIYFNNMPKSISSLMMTECTFGNIRKLCEWKENNIEILKIYNCIISQLNLTYFKNLKNVFIYGCFISGILTFPDDIRGLYLINNTDNDFQLSLHNNKKLEVLLYYPQMNIFDIVNQLFSARHKIYGFSKSLKVLLTTVDFTEFNDIDLSLILTDIYMYKNIKTKFLVVEKNNKKADIYKLCANKRYMIYLNKCDVEYGVYDGVLLCEPSVDFHKEYNALNNILSFKDFPHYQLIKECAKTY